MSTKVIRDPIYGYIDVTPEQLEVINLPVFQRLRRISQLSFSELVYPNATHNRFAHSLGVMHLARLVRRYLDKESDVGSKLGLTKEDYDALEWAGLLHDIGHLPFSHVSEAPFAYFLEKKDDWKNYHVSIGVKIIQDPGFKIKGNVPDNILDKVVRIMDKDTESGCSLLDAMMDGLCSVDRLDYLRRDAHHAGCPEYAIIDYERILATLIHYPKDSSTTPVFKEKARYALEGVVLSYFNMYRAMYYHHAVRSAFLLYQDIIWDAFDKFGLKDDLKELWEPDFWNNFDDHQFLAIIRSKEGLADKWERLVTRRLPKNIKDSEITKYNGRKIVNLLRKGKGGSLKDKVEKEREILQQLQTSYPNLEMILLDSPILVPYPDSPFADKVIYTWSERESEEPKNLAEKATYLTDLDKVSDQQLGVRVYVYPRCLTTDGDFVTLLNKTITEVLK